MAEIQKKRMREEEGEEEEEAKRTCFHHILSLLEADEEEPSDDLLSSLLTDLQHELSSDSLSHPTPQPNQAQEEQEDRVIRYLLEASDHELGIPPSPVVREQHEEDEYEEERETNSSKETNNPSTSIYDGFWELEDESANYYFLLQSELLL